MRVLKALALVLALGSCDEATVITHVDKLSHMALDDLWTMQSDGAVPVEVHGNPFSSVDKAALASALRAPAAADKVRFRHLPFGEHAGNHGWRLVLHFNGLGPPNSQADCRLSAEAETGPRPDEGFTVNATFCKGTDWQAHGFMRSLKTADGDLDSLRDTMQQLMLAIFAENADADR